MSNVTDAAALGGPTGPVGRSGRRRLALIVLAILAVIAVVLGGGAFAYAKQFEGKALPGTTVLGQDVSGKTPEEIAASVTERADGVAVTVNADGTAHEASLADLGVSVDAPATAERAVQHESSIPEVVSSTVSGERTVDPVVSVDRKAVSDFAASLIPEDRTVPVDAKVTYDEDAGSWTVVEGTPGQGVDAEQLVSEVTENAPALEDFSVDQKITEIAPAITTEEAETTLDEVMAIIEQPMSISGPDGSTHEVSSERRSGWISVDPNEDGDALAISVDEESVREWVADRADEDAVEKKDGIEKVDASGKTVEVVAKKKDGVEITNTDAVADELVASLEGSTPLEASFESKTVEAEVTKAKSDEKKDEEKDAEKDEKSKDEKKKDEEKDAEKDEKSAEPSEEPAEPTGEKWIEADLSAKTVTAYVGDTPVWGPVSMVDGKEGYETVTGTYEIYLRNEVQDLTNASKYDEDHPKYYYTPDVPWVQYFHNGYAFHGAPWRSSFGYSGSHGCVNLTVADAKWLWDWAEVGTRVEVHR